VTLLVFVQFLSAAWIPPDENQMLRSAFAAFIRERPRYQDKPAVIYVDAKRASWQTIAQPEVGSRDVVFRDAASFREAPGVDRNWIDPSTGRRLEFISIKLGRLGVVEGTVHVRWTMGPTGIEVWTFKLWRVFGRWIVVGREARGVA
jgi:hypothetical protein